MEALIPKFFTIFRLIKYTMLILIRKRRFWVNGFNSRCDLLGNMETLNMTFHHRYLTGIQWSLVWGLIRGYFRVFGLKWAAHDSHRQG